MRPVVYVLSFLDGSEYVGATTSFAHRSKQHLTQPQNKRIAAKQAQLGPPAIEIVACAFSRAELHLLEAQVIHERQPELNFNYAPLPILTGLSGRRRKRGAAPAGKPFGPYPSLNAAAKAMKVERHHLRRFDSYEAFLASKAKRAVPT